MPRRRIITAHAQHRQMKHMHLLRTAHQHVADARHKVHHNTLLHAILQDDITLMTMHTADKNSLRVMQQVDIGNALLHCQRLDYRELLLKTIILNQLLHALALVVDYNCLGSREQHIVSYISCHAPQSGQHQLHSKGSHNRPYIWQLTLQQKRHHIHNAARHHHGQSLTIYALGNAVQRNPKAAIHSAKNHIQYGI